MLTDLITAHADDADAILSSSGHANMWPTLECRSVDPLKLASLAFILRSKPLHGDALGTYAQSFKRLVDCGDEGPWIDLLPDDLAHDLAALSEEQIPNVARAWTATEAAQLNRWELPETTALLKDLSSFAGSATAEGKNLLLWMSL